MKMSYNIIWIKNADKKPRFQKELETKQRECWKVSASLFKGFVVPFLFH